MFVRAYEISRQYTMPIIISHRNVKKECFSGIGSFVVINNEGWCVTAGHIVSEIEKLHSSSTIVRDTEERKRVILENRSIVKKEKLRQIKGLPQYDGKAPLNFSAWWGGDTVVPEKVVILKHIDLAFVKLKGLNVSLIQTYPKFKNTSKGLNPGKSLCRIGFPFAEITPTYDETSGTFSLPPGSLPLPLFPNEGIFTRTVVIQSDSDPVVTPQYPHLFLETSSPGLRGQSGGPIFDSDGNIWAIQSQTRHYPLGFSPDVPNGRKGEKEHQFLNIGWGVHVTTVVGAMNDLQISHNISEN